MKSLMGILALTAAVAVTSAQGTAVTIDHLILGINDLERGIAEFEKTTGVRPVAGGVHPGRGTWNALASPMVDELKPLTRLTPVGAAMPGSRMLPDGSRLQWSTLNVTLPVHNWLPFFIKWADPAKHPSRTTPTGCALASMRIDDPNPDPLTHVFSAIGLKVQTRKSEQSRMTMALKCPNGTATF